MSRFPLKEHWSQVMVFPVNPLRGAKGRQLPQNGQALLAAFEPLENDKPWFPTLTRILLITGLGFLSWLATYTGMLELIMANAGEVDLSYRIAIAFAVVMLMLMIIYLLDALFSPISWWLRIVYVFGYLFLTLISVGFGFGFYWKYLEARSEATRSAESAVGQVQTALQSGQARLQQLETTFSSLTVLSAAKAEEERTKGGTCPKSPPGDGPRRRLRDADAKNFSFAADFARLRAGAFKADITALNTDMAKILSTDRSTIDPKTGTRNAFLKGLSRKLDMTITRFNAFRTDPQLRQFRDNFATRAEQVIFNNGSGGTFRCPDPQLQIVLRGVVKAIDGLPDLTKPPISAVEGSRAIVEAFRRLTVTIAGAFTLSLPPTPDELRALQQKAVRSVVSTRSPNPALEMKSGLGENDYIPLFIAIFVDVCILLVSINRPVNRMQRLMASAHEARQAQVHQILARFHDVHAKERSQRLDILHDVMFDSHGEQYIAVPLNIFPEGEGLDISDETRQRYRRKAIEARYLATLLAALEAGGLVKKAPIVTQARVKKRLTLLGSSFANSTTFRVYRFANGAWPAIVLDDMLGASQKIDAEEAAQAARQAEINKAEGQALSSGLHVLEGDIRPGMAQDHAMNGNGTTGAKNKSQDKCIKEEPPLQPEGAREQDLGLGRNRDLKMDWRPNPASSRQEPFFHSPLSKGHRIDGRINGAQTAKPASDVDSPAPAPGAGELPQRQEDTGSLFSVKSSDDGLETTQMAASQPYEATESDVLDKVPASGVVHTLPGANRQPDLFDQDRTRVAPPPATALRKRIHKRVSPMRVLNEPAPVNGEFLPPLPGEAQMRQMMENEKRNWDNHYSDFKHDQDMALGGASEDTALASENANLDIKSIAEWFKPGPAKNGR